MSVNTIPTTFGTGGSGLNPTSDPVNNLQKILADHATAINTLLGTPAETLGAAIVVSTTNITLSGTQTIDGVAVVAGNRILVTGQTTAANNGIYVVASGAWLRSVDFNSTTQMNAGVLVPVFSGTIYGGSVWEFTTPGPIGLGSTTLTFVQTSGTSTATAPKQAANLTDASPTVNPGTDAASQYTLPAATLSVNRTLTLGTTGSPPTNLVVQVIRRDLTAHTFAIVNGGTGAGTMLTFASAPASAQGASFYFDGTNWNLLNFFYVAT